MVNDEKVNRAKGIIALLSNNAKTEEEAVLKSKFGALLAEAKLKPESAKALEFVYVKLGGLVRTEAEQKAAAVKKAALRKRKNVTR